MPIITVASTKGGVGKSTFILNLATILLSKGKKVVILDGDSQNTISKWNKVREFMITEGSNLGSMFVASAQGNTLIDIANDKNAQGYIVLIDSPGVDDASMRSALLRSDYVITTCPPSPVDLWEVETLTLILKKLQNIQGRKIPLILVFNKASSNIKERASFKHSIRDGKGVIEYTPSDAKAIEEITNCYEEIASIIKNKNN